MQLSEWEERIKERFDRIELIGELDITESDVADMAPQIRQHIERWGQKNGLGILLARYHRTWMTFLVFQGVYGYSEGDFWSSVADATGIQNRTALNTWGRLFYLSLERFGLPTFPNQSGHIYVTRILLHGGIPQAALPNFFDHFLEQPLKHPELATLAPTDLIEHLLVFSSAKYALIKPVRRFLVNGGAIATDLVARSLELANVYATTGAAPAAKEIGLPERIVEAYMQWVEGRTISVRSSSAHLKRPQIRLDPYGDGIIAVLPSQSIDDPSLTPGCCWTLHLDSTILQHPVRSFRRRSGWQTEENWVVLNRPYSECRISFRDGRSIGQSWRFSGLASQLPLLIFDADTSSHRELRAQLPAGQYWLVYPDTYSLEVLGGRLVEDAGSLPWDWFHYRVRLWDLASAKQVQLLEPGGTSTGTQSLSVPVEVNPTALRPWLEGGDVVSGCQGDSPREPVYSGGLPTICIPVPPQRSAAIELTRWQVTVTDESSGSRRSLALSQGTSGVVISDSHIRIYPVESGLLDGDPFGAFNFSLRGPLGKDTVFKVVAVPNLVIEGGERVRLAGDNDQARPGLLHASVAPWLEVASLDPETSVVQEQAGQFRVTIAPDRATGALQIRRLETLNEDQGPEVYVQVAAPMLQWALIDTPRPLGQDDWQTTPITRPKAWLDQVDSPQLIVSLAPTNFAGPELSGHLSIQYQHQGVPQFVESTGGSSRFLRFQLREILDTVRNSAAGFVNGHLELNSLGEYQAPVSLPIVRFTETLQAKGLELSSELEEGCWNLHLGWESMGLLANRHVRLWSCSRPWIQPIELTIPDGAQSQSRWRVDQRQAPPGPYRIELLVSDPWAPTAPVRPSPGSHNCLEAVLGTPAELFVYISHLPATVEGYLEKALLTNDIAVRSQALREMSERFDASHIPFALDVLLSMPADEGEGTILLTEQSPEVAVLQALLLDPPHELMQAVADRVGGLSQAEQIQLKRLLIALGIGSCPLARQLDVDQLTSGELDTLWTFWPVLGVLIEGDRLIMGNRATWSRASARLSLHDLEVVDDESVLLESHVLPDLAIAKTLRGGPPENHLLHLSAQHLRFIAQALNIVPKGLFARDQWLVANMAWLIACKQDPERERSIAHWVRSHIDPVCAAVQTIAEEALVPEQLVSLVAERFDRRDLNPLIHVPFVVGATALIQRTIAHNPSAKAFLHSIGSGWDSMALRMMDIAPELFERDMCILELMYTQQVAREVPT